VHGYTGALQANSQRPSSQARESEAACVYEYGHTCTLVRPAYFFSRVVTSDRPAATARRTTSSREDDRLGVGPRA